MADFIQHGLISTIHDLGTIEPEQLESLLSKYTESFKIGLILPVTASDMRAEPFKQIVEKLKGAKFIDQTVVVLGVAPSEADFQETHATVRALGDSVQVLWTDGPRMTALYQELIDAGLNLSIPGKGRSVWTAYGYLMADPSLKAYALHDCDIRNYERQMLARLCLPLAHPGLDFEFCKAFYARTTDRMHGRVVRLLVQPLLRALIATLGHDRFLMYLDSFRYPLSGEFAVTSNLARSNRIPSDWGLEVGTLAEVFRNTSVKRVCQVDICRQYEHKHQPLSLEDPDKGLMKMSRDILTSLFRNLASMGTVMQPGHFVTLRSAFLRAAQDCVRQYHADAIVNGLTYDRHQEEGAIEGFAKQIIVAGELYQQDPSGGASIPNWTRVLTAFPDFPSRLREVVKLDAEEFATAK
ncbi:MAG: glycosyl transferase [Planctomycetota bacterium]